MPCEHVSIRVVSRIHLLAPLLILACSEAETPRFDCKDVGGAAACRAFEALDAAPGEVGIAYELPAAAQLPDAAPIERPERVPNETCALPAPPPEAYATEPAFGRLRFRQPLWVGSDGSERMYVIEKCHGVRTFTGADPLEHSPFLELEPACDNEQGVLGLAFHPGYAENGRFFVYYSLTSPRRSIISEFHRDPADPSRALPASERRVLVVGQPFKNHNGGDLHFGPDGLLYVALGDGGSGGDPMAHGQRPSTLLGSILRIDVDGREPYGIPPDNPFAICGQVCGDAAVARAEVYAWGLRNPWRMSFDSLTGELWAADVGQDEWEEVNRIVKGGNYGWDLREAEACFEAETCRDEGLEPPVFAYDHGQGVSITGGYVYRGPDLPDLRGEYVYGDFRNGRIWGLREGRNRLLVDTPHRISTFGTDALGRLYYAAFNGGTLHRLAAAEQGEARPIPRRLSETGCFADTATHTLAPGVVAFGVRVPLWSDGTRKSRALALPPGTRVDLDRAEGFPEGSVLIKTFEHAGRRIETRMLALHGGAWRGYTWRWSADQADAQLLEGALREEVAGLDWSYPSRAECEACHTPEAGQVLGFRKEQLDLEALRPWVEATPIEPWPALEGPGDPGLRARAYLEVNCAFCHRDPQATPALDLRMDAAPPCEVEPQSGDLGLAGAKLVAKGGDVARSLLLQRMLRRGRGQMPPLGTHRVDPVGARIVAEWLQGEACP